MRNIILITTVGLIALVFVVGAFAATEISDTAQTAQTSIPSDKDKNFNTEEKQKLVTDAINKYREENGVFRIKENLFVTLPTGKFTRSLVEDSHWGTSTADGKEYSEFIKESGYKANEMGLAMSRGYTDMNQILESWKTNKDTNDTLLDSKFTNVGVYWDKYESGEDILIVFFADTPQKHSSETTMNTQAEGKTAVSQPVATPTLELRYDGTRTGPIISYNSYCENKEVSIHQNELYKYTDTEGQTWHMTQSDIICWERDLANHRSNMKYYNSFDNSKYADDIFNDLRATFTPYPTPDIGTIDANNYFEKNKQLYQYSPPTNTPAPDYAPVPIYGNIRYR